MEFVDHGGFPDPRIARNEHQLRGAPGDNPAECRQKTLDFRLAPIEFFRDQQAVGHIMGAQWERVDSAVRLPFHQAAA